MMKGFAYLAAVVLLICLELVVTWGVYITQDVHISVVRAIWRTIHVHVCMGIYYVLHVYMCMYAYN